MDVLGVSASRHPGLDPRGGGALKPLDPRLLRTASAARVLLAVGAVVAVAHTLSIVAFCWFAAQSIVGVIDGATLVEVGPSIAATAVAIATRAATQALLDALAARGAATVKSQLRRRVIAAIDAAGARMLTTRSSAHTATLLGQGLDAMDGYIGRYLPQLILTAVATPIVVGVLLFADPVTGITVILTLPIIPVFMVLIGMATQAVQTKQWRLLGTLAQGFLEVVQGLSTLMVFGRHHRQATRIAEVTDQYRRRTMSVLRLSFLSGFTLELAASLSVALVAVSVGIRLIDGDVSLALGLFVLILVPEAYLPLRQVGAQFHAASEGIAAADDVLDLLESAPAAESSEPPSAPTTLGVPPPPEVATARSLSTPAALELRGLTVRRGERIVVDGLTASWQPGTLLAITGPSGTGKSSLFAALLGLIDADGEVLINGMVRAADERRSQLAWAGQRPELTGGTIDEVVALGSDIPDAERVTRALARAAVDDVSRDTVLGAAGQGLSGGQAQRIAIARAHYRALERNCAIVLLDEPTSALDADTEARVIRGLRELANEGRLVAIITHRRAVMAAADALLSLGAQAPRDADRRQVQR